MSHFILFMTSIHLYILKLEPIPVDRSDVASPSQDWPQIKERQAIINANMHTYHQFWVAWKSKDKGFWVLQFNQLDLRLFVFFFLVFEDISSLIEKASSVLKTIQDSQVFNPLWGFHFGNSPYGFWPALWPCYGKFMTYVSICVGISLCRA